MLPLAAGVIYDRLGKWQIGVDYAQQQWSNYRFFGEKDAVQDSWQMKIGAQIDPLLVAKPTGTL